MQELKVSTLCVEGYGFAVYHFNKRQIQIAGTSLAF